MSMRIVFIGASKFGLRCLEQIISLPCCKIVGAVTAPQTFSISYRPQGVNNVLFADVKSYCDVHDIDCVVMEKGMKDSDLFGKVRASSPDVFIVAGWYHMIPKRWRDLAPAYGLHASLLPDYSGGAPLVWAMINGEKKTGITFFLFDDGVDSGPVLGQAETEIHDDDTIATLYTRIEELGLTLITEHMPVLTTGTAVLTPQDENKRRIFPQRSPEDGLIDWKQSAAVLFNFIRAQTRPYPGAFTTYQGRRLSVWAATKTKIQDVPEASVGEVLAERGKLLVKTFTVVLELNEVDYEEKTISGQEFRRLVGGGAILGG
jgi:methionyl-tRNA formyltransferase